MAFVTPELLSRLLDEQAEALEAFAAQWSSSPADVVQEALIELAKQPAAPENIVAWLYTVVRNRALSEVRSSMRRRRREQDWHPPSSHAADAEVDVTDVAALFDALPDNLREIVVARPWGGLTFEQIGAVCGVSPSTATRRYADAIAILPQKLDTPCPTKTVCINR